MADTLGPLVRLWGITTSQLPASSATPAGLTPLLMSLLQEAVPFVDSAAPKSGGAAPAWKSKGSKSLEGSTARIHLTERVVPAAELKLVAGRNPTLPATQSSGKISSETWICRRSVHADAAAAGTATWAEFLACIRDAHAETEVAFTPTVLGCRDALVWDCGTVEITEGGESWSGFTLRVEEMKHRIPSPLGNRVFPVMQMACSAVPKAEGGRGLQATEEFLVVSVPVVDFASAPQALMSKEKAVVVGSYVSVERVRKLPSGEIEWIMATASDAKGILPMWVQTRAVPGQIAKDVPLFLRWLQEHRKGLEVPAITEVKGSSTAGGTPVVVATSGNTATDATTREQQEPASEA
ncbi:DUF3074 domain-containing protein [Pleurostoma richardsiae]|uniref:DUF3074 domain-containing protein n=1 Tax=Pleurostoma richardsiae TaxID=41990 RepID=A0AA38S2Y5_9PEZI|nr:DUF3074 domain-containing protein [Pleurostoma richardsiae]